MEILPDIHRIEVSLGPRILCLYLLAGRRRALLVDTGTDQTPYHHLLPYLNSIGLSAQQIDYVLITHPDWDHQGGNVSVREIAPQATFICHALDQCLIESIDQLIENRYGEFQKEHQIDESAETKAWIRQNNRSEIPIDLTLTGGESLLLDEKWRIQVWHTPGHSAGHLSIYDPKNRAAIIADAVLWNCVPNRDGTPAFPPTYRYLQTYLSTVRFLTNVPIETLLTAHYPVFSGREVGEFLAESRSFAERLDTMLRRELAGMKSPRTTRQLIESLSSRAGGWPTEAGIYLAFPLVGHLELLERAGSIERIRSEGEVQWRWKS